MKVWEQVNQLKGTNESFDTIKDWAYTNRICPATFEDGLELDCKYPEQLYKIANGLCCRGKCGIECLKEFLNSDFE